MPLPPSSRMRNYSPNALKARTKAARPRSSSNDMVDRFLATFDAILKAARHHGEHVQVTTESCDLRAMIDELVLLQTPRAPGGRTFSRGHGR